MKVHPQWLRQAKSHLLDPCATVSPTEDQIFKYVNLWRHSHANYHSEVQAYLPPSPHLARNIYRADIPDSKKKEGKDGKKRLWCLESQQRRPVLWLGPVRYQQMACLHCSSSSAYVVTYNSCPY